MGIEYTAESWRYLYGADLGISVSIVHSNNVGADATSEAVALFRHVVKEFRLDTGANQSLAAIGATPAIQASNITGSSPSAGPSQPAATGSTSATGRALGRTITVTGTEDGSQYRVTTVADDSFSPCSKHAYGAAMLSFLDRHRNCDAARSLVTVPLNGRTAVVSMIVASFTTLDSSASATNAAYNEAARLRGLERANGTGSIDDLLRDGARVPRIGSEIPSSEAFDVECQDATTVIFDAWWETGATANNDPALLTLERNLYLTAAQPVA